MHLRFLTWLSQKCRWREAILKQVAKICTISTNKIIWRELSYWENLVHNFRWIFSLWFWLFTWSTAQPQPSTIKTRHCWVILSQQNHPLLTSVVPMQRLNSHDTTGLYTGAGGRWGRSDSSWAFLRWSKIKRNWSRQPYFIFQMAACGNHFLVLVYIQKELFLVSKPKYA